MFNNDDDLVDVWLLTESTRIGGDGVEFGGGVNVAEPAARNNAAAWSAWAAAAAAATANVWKWGIFWKKFCRTNDKLARVVWNESLMLLLFVIAALLLSLLLPLLFSKEALNNWGNSIDNGILDWLRPAPLQPAAFNCDNDAAATAAIA